jgi:hypothetical protein
VFQGLSLARALLAAILLHAFLAHANGSDPTCSINLPSNSDGVFLLNSAADFVTMQNGFISLSDAGADADACWQADFLQTADVTLTGVWHPIGLNSEQDENFTFFGSLDGGNHDLRGLRIVVGRYNYNGLFARIEGAHIQRVRLIEPTLEFANPPVGNRDYAGFLAGAAYVSVMESITVTSYTISSSDSHKYVGGVVGQAVASVLRDASVSGSITAGGGNKIGGIVGGMDDGALLERATAYVNLDTSASEVGGLVGEAEDGSLVRDSLVLAGSLVRGENKVGGAVGEVDEASVLLLHSEAEVTGRIDIGGAIGYLHEGTANQISSSGDVHAIGFEANARAGGLVGYLLEGSVVRGFVGRRASDGSILGVRVTSTDADVGGLVGYAHDSSVSHSVAYTVEVSGSNRVGGLIGRTNDVTQVDNAAFATLISGGSYVGGMTGREGGDINRGSGILGALSVATTVSASDLHGPMIGSVAQTSAGGFDRGVVVGGFFNSQISNRAETRDPNAYGVGRTSAQLHSAATYRDAGWAITDYSQPLSNSAGNVWGICPGSYPFHTYRLSLPSDHPAYLPTPTCIPEPEASADATLAALTSSAGALSPAFDPGTRSYTLTLASNQGSALITATAADAMARVSLNGVGNAAATALSVSVDVGTPTTVVISVRAENGDTQTTTLTLLREAASGDAPAIGRTIDDEDGVWVHYSFSGSVLNVQVEIDGAWQPLYNPALTTSPLFIAGLSSASELRLRVLTSSGLSQASATFAADPVAASAPSIDLELTTSDTVVSDDGRTATLTLTGTITNTGDAAIENLWLNPTTSGTISGISGEDGRGTLEKLGGAWHWSDLNLAAGASTTLTLTLTVEVQ